MKYLVLALFSSACHAGDWTLGDTAREAAFVGLLAVDCKQSQAIARDPAHHGERNAVVRSIIGSHPTGGRFNNLCAATALGHGVISYALPPDWRFGWQVGTIVVEAGVVLNNRHVLVAIRIPLGGR